MYIPGAQHFTSSPDSKPKYGKYSDVPEELIADIELDSTFANTSHISFVSHFKYLGTYISWNLDDAYDVKERIKSANKIFGAVKRNFYGSSSFPLELCIRWFNAIVVNVLLCGCQSWALRSKHRNDLQVCYRQHLRTMLRVTVFHKIQNEKLLELARVHDIMSILHLHVRRCRWLEKLAYMPRTRIPRQLFAGWICDPKKKRPRARPF